ncbi:hypothetical protein BBD39_07380 [Arsenophonus endosymbiont of Bemisia tabaci Asia II 3]|nr:hypothetical protein BBD39_07380 [Arsenophonus endosymbiont of Bemisia tabaci Asia II 3]
MDIIKKIRAENVKYLIESFCEGNKSEFARRIKSSVQHVSKILNALGPKACALNATSKKYVGDEMAHRIEQAFNLNDGELSTKLLNGNSPINEIEMSGLAPFIKWEDIDNYINNVAISLQIMNIPMPLSDKSFITRLPGSVGGSIHNLAIPGDLIAVEVDANVENLANNNYILARLENAENITCWKFKKIGVDVLLQNEEFPDRVYDKITWKLVGLIKFSIRGI